MNSVQTGLGRIRLLIIVASFGILAAVAAVTVMYQNSQLRSKFGAVVSATEPFKKAIELCARFGPCAASGTLSGLGEGILGIPYSSSGTYLASVRVASNG